MTVCVAALAAKANVIVCVADKALSYGDHIQWDSDSSKILKLNPSGTLVMFSGDEESTQRVLANLISVGDEIGRKPRREIIKICEAQYKEAVDDLIETKFLRPRLLTKQDYVRAITAPKLNHMLRSLADEIKKFQIGCDVMVCGFDDKKKPFILEISSPGVVTDMTMTGFHAIGSGWDKAVSRLLFAEHKREHTITRVVYDAFDAKANAEMAAGVGYQWDGVVALHHETPFVVITDRAKELLERAWAKFNRSPFEKRDRKKDLPNPPRNWEQELLVEMASQIGIPEDNEDADEEPTPSVSQKSAGQR